MEKHWQQGGLGFGAAFRDVYTDPKANAIVSDFVRDKISERVEDPATAALLQPKFSFGCKRACVDTDYYKTFNRPNVHLVDIKNQRLKFTPSGLFVGERQLDLDAIILATGYDAMTGAIAKVDIKGTQGRLLSERWANGPVNYLGLQMAEFPNLFMCTGPGSPSVLSNMISSIEQHVDWIVDCLASVRKRGAATIEARLDGEDWWMRHLAAVAKPTVFSWGCTSSWYQGANIPGKPRILTPYFGGVGRYRAVCDAEAASGYKGFLLKDPAGKVIRPSALESWGASSRRWLYQMLNTWNVIMMALSAQGNSLVGSAWPDSKLRVSAASTPPRGVHVLLKLAVVLPFLCMVWHLLPFPQSHHDLP